MLHRARFAELRRCTVAALCCATGAVMAEVPQGSSSLHGTQVTIHNGPGNQFDPHVSGDWVAYSSSASGLDQIRYFHFGSSEDRPVPNALPGGGTAFDFLSDVSGSTVVFTRVVPGRNAICAYDAATHGPVVELDPLAGSRRQSAAIGGSTVAWVDFGYSVGGLQTPEMVAYDLVSGTSQRLTQDTAFDRAPSVGPLGDVVAWERCATSSAPCDIAVARRDSGGAWSWSLLTQTVEGETAPDVGDDLVVYASARGGATGWDLFWRDLSGGTENQLELEGDQRNPSVGRDWVAFESQSPGELSTDIYLYRLSTRMLYRLTRTSDLNETLNDVWVSPSGLAKVVWSVGELDENVYGFTFQAPASCTAPVTSCASPGSRPLLAKVDARRDGDSQRSTRLVAVRRYDPADFEDGVSTHSPPLRFELPVVIPVTKGTSKFHSVNFSFITEGQPVSCRYLGGEEHSHPKDKSKLAKPRKYVLKDCTDGSQAGATLSATELRLHLVNGDKSVGMTEVELELDEAEWCSGYDCGGPDITRAEFRAAEAGGLLCIDNGYCGAHATCGAVFLNGTQVADPASADQVAVTLSAENRLDVAVGGRYGAGYRVRVYGADPTCTQQQSAEVGEAVSGERLEVVGGRHFLQSEATSREAALSAGGRAVGCASSGQSGWTLVGLGMLGAALLRRRPRQARAHLHVRARAR